MEAIIKAAKAVLREELDKVEVHPCDYHDDTVRAGRLYGPYRELWDAIEEQAKGQAAPVLAEDQRWTCFHCSESFTDRASAALHFGTTERQQPACAIDIAKYREMEEAVRRHAEDDTDLDREIYRLRNEQHVIARRNEEKGYARGLKDAATQRTASGDAVPESDLLSDLKEAVSIAMAAARKARSDAQRVRWLTVLNRLVAQPVAEAAAQADDPIRAMQEYAQSVADAYAAAPTAQPTPPDDERAAFDEWASRFGLDTVRWADDSSAYVEPGTNDAWAAWQARAALRQPGALPDGAEDAARLEFLAYKATILMAHGAGFAMQARPGTLDEMRTWIDSIRAAAATKEN